MAQAIGISLSAPGAPNTEAATAGTVTKASSALVPWLSGALVAAGLAAGAYVATRSRTQPSTPSALPPPTPSASAASSTILPSLAPIPARSDAPLELGEDASPKTPSLASSQRGRRATAAGELATQIALVDAARSAHAAGKTERSLSAVREYQSQYPSGTFRPEVAAVKIEALLKVGRTSEARALAERFVVAYGPGPLAERVARLAQIAEP